MKGGLRYPVPDRSQVIDSKRRDVGEVDRARLESVAPLLNSAVRTRTSLTAYARRILPRSRQRPVAVVEGSLTKKVNKTAVRLWTDPALDNSGEVGRRHSIAYASDRQATQPGYCDSQAKRCGVILTAILTAKPTETVGFDGTRRTTNCEFPEQKKRAASCGQHPLGFVISRSSVQVRAPAN